MSRYVLVINDGAAYEFASHVEALSYLSKWCINGARKWKDERLARELEAMEKPEEICSRYFERYDRGLAVCLPLTQPEEI